MAEIYQLSAVLGFSAILGFSICQFQSIQEIPESQI